MGRPDNGLGKPGEKSKGFGLSAEAIAKLRQVQDFNLRSQTSCELSRFCDFSPI